MTNHPQWGREYAGDYHQAEMGKVWSSRGEVSRRESIRTVARNALTRSTAYVGCLARGSSGGPP